MKTDSKIQIFLLGFIILIVSASYLSFISKNSNLTIATSAEILEIQPKYSRESDGLSVWWKKQNASVIYRYELNGEPARGETIVSFAAARNLKIGEKVKLCYNPQNHKEIEINCVKVNE
ncbi:MAG TPA: hypothetical protein VGB68_03400 [Pyrinomonadaceae bacterium]